MKKVFSMAAIALFMALTSCSGDDSSETTNPSTETVLLKKIITTDEDGNAITTNYTYDGTKVVKITDSEGVVANYYYEGDLPVKVEYVENNILTQRDVFTYANGNLSSMTILDLDEDWGHKTLFHYNNGSITTESFSGDIIAQSTLTDTGVITINNGNITDYTITREGGGQTSWTYTFDTKNSPGKNFTAGHILALAYQEGGVNNILSYVNESYDEGYTITYQYNEAGYPVSDTETNIDGTVTTTQYFYE